MIRQQQENGQEIEIPSDKMFSLMPGLERLMAESRITMDMANAIISSRRVPLELAKYLGLLAHSGPSTLDFSPSVAPCLSPLTVNFGGPLSNGYRSTPGGLASQSNSGCSSPSTFGGGCGSPMHQITKGISGLTTGGGSISKGTSLASEAQNQVQVPLDLTMESDSDVMGAGGFSAPWYVPPNYYDMNPLNLSSAQPIRMVPTPPASPSLCIIQEEFSNMQPMSATIVINGPQDQLRHISLETTPTNDDSQYPHLQHPQICLTDVQGSEITLVGCQSDSSSRGGDSDDSLDISRPTQLMNLQGLVITEPSSDMPSITRGVGRKTSLENSTDNNVAGGSNSAASSHGPSANVKLETDNYIRRGSDKSLGFSDDSLSNDSNNLSPSAEPSQSSGFKSSDSHSETGELMRLSPDSLGENRTPSELCYEMELPQGCSNLDASKILQYVKSVSEERMGTAPRKTSLGADNLNLEYNGGLHIELQVCEGKAKERGHNSSPNRRNIKLRRISGDESEYGKLAQQLISSLRV